MCGRYTLTKNFQAIKGHFKIIQSSIGFEPRFNIAPSQSVPVILSDNNRFSLHAFRWGLIPYWSENPSMGNRLINARAETIREKPSFKYSFKSKRCLVPVDGFYEWQGTGKQKTPHFIHLENNILFAFAGLWAEWKQREEVVRSFCIITTQANGLLKPIHHRMPVILSPDEYESWLDPGAPAESLTVLLRPYPEVEMAFHAVSKKVNLPKNDSPACLQPEGILSE